MISPAKCPPRPLISNRIGLYHTQPLSPQLSSMNDSPLTVSLLGSSQFGERRSRIALYKKESKEQRSPTLGESNVPAKKQTFGKIEGGEVLGMDG